MTAKSGPDMNAIISGILKYGLIISSLMILAGIALLPTLESSRSFPSSLSQLIGENYAQPTLQPSVLLQGVVSFDPLYLIQLGLLLLLATPLVRVGASVLLFASERDLTYVAITMTVLIILLFSIFVIGPWHATATGELAG